MVPGIQGIEQNEVVIQIFSFKAGHLKIDLSDKRGSYRQLLLNLIADPCLYDLMKEFVQYGLQTVTQQQ